MLCVIVGVWLSVCYVLLVVCVCVGVLLFCVYLLVGYVVSVVCVALMGCVWSSVVFVYVLLFCWFLCALCFFLFCGW